MSKKFAVPKGHTLVMRPLKDLQTNLFVRQGLVPDRVMQMALVLDGGGELPPILITQNDIVIDGRHRYEAHHLAKRTEVACLMIDRVLTPVEIIALAHQANLGGALPPTTADIEQVVMMLLGEHVAHTKIIQILGLPAAVCRIYITNAKSKLDRTKLLAAQQAMAEENLNVTEAAAKYGVAVDKLKAAIDGKGGSKRRLAKRNDVNELHKQLGAEAFTYSRKLGQFLRNLVDMLSSTEISYGEAMKLLGRVEHLQKQRGRAIESGIARVKALGNVSSKVAPGSPKKAAI